MSSHFIIRLISSVTAALILTSCAVPKPYPLSLPQGKAVRLVMPKNSVNLQVVVTPTVGTAYAGSIGNNTYLVTMTGDLAKDGNKSNTTRLQNEMKGKEQVEPLGKLFEDEVRSRIHAMGGKLISDESIENHGPTITLENLTASYFAETFLSSYEPTAFVFLNSSTDPITTGNREGAVARTIEARLSQPEFTFRSSGALHANPDKAYIGLRTVVTELADRVAKAIVNAQLTGEKQ